jgi:hypothetical protein
MAFIERETEILKTIKTMVNEGFDFIVVGGYAVSSLARHRFSVDCDIVISKRNIKEYEELLEREGFEKHLEMSGFDEVYSGEFMSYRKDVSGLPVTVDLLIEALVCRATGAAWSFAYIKKHSVEGNIPGIEASVRCKIPEKELLIAFKVHSGRRADIRDIVMLYENSDTEKILNYLRRGNIESIKKQIPKIIDALQDVSLINSLKGVFTLTIDVRKRIENTEKFMNILLTKI